MNDESFDEFAVGVADKDMRLTRRRSGVVLQLRRNADRLPCFQPIARLGAFAIDAHLARAQEFLQMAVRDSRKPPLEPTVEPDSGFVLIDVGDAAHAKLRTSASPANKAATDRTTEPTI